MKKILLFSIILLSGCGSNTFTANDLELQEPIELTISDEANPLKDIKKAAFKRKYILLNQEPEAYSTTAELYAVGDIMMHYPQILHGYDKEVGQYSFDSYFTEVKDLFVDGEWVIGNLETPLAGEAVGYSGYPQFNAPEQLADALKNAGFNILTTANNHSLDRRENGVINTLKFLDERKIHSTGTAASREEAQQLLTVSKNEINMGFLAYTYGTNGIPIPEGKEYLVNLIDNDQMANDIQKLKTAGVDIVTVSVHFGSEYQRNPNELQKNIVKHLIKSGADIILGSHPHVVQPYEFLELQGYDGEMKKGIVIYSLGNFISNQGPDQGTALYTDVGVIFKVAIEKHFPENKTVITHIETIPTWVHKYYADNKKNYRILPIKKMITSKEDEYLPSNTYPLLETYFEEVSQHLHSINAIPIGGFSN
ncbi:CapA family protein [Chengkuizengella axinellae]|uniref:CapA family protein n=1 Tax=Chengkuizengella axinellae TaxID=3064388 RepID=A0ABT9IX72_9BACL|nr:CapA family protein [Chengkuizengella sp. 2205SS18-9]MDP5273912.1 CapA family protein [Chengkuizengella sp. 2205SS18-9]